MIKINEKLEKEVEVNGKIYEIDLSFDNVINLLELLKNPGIGDGEKVYLGLYLLLGTELEFEPDQQVIVFEALIKNFIHETEDQEAQVDLAGNVMPIAAKPQSYDLIHDSSYIYTSFRQAYQMNLYNEQGKLDWREFKALLQDLPDETKFKQVVDIRTRPYPKGKGMGEERQKLKELKRTFALPGTQVDD